MDAAYTILDRLLDRLLDGVIVPFLGAGVSNRARSRRRDCGDRDSDFGTYHPTVWHLVRRLVRSLLADLRATGADADGLRALLLPTSPWILPPPPPAHPPSRTVAAVIAATSDEKALVDYLIELSASRLDKWTEAHVAKRGWANTVEVLRIDRMADLEPQPAHAYLAYLAREGLVSEVITSNYDTCLELAVERSLLPGGRDPAGLPVRVVCDLEDYRRDGATTQTGPATLRRPVLHVYKINGCAERYRASLVHPRQQPDYAERIVLTERQLQTFRGERWAEDLLRDRSRCRALLFCGFGSDEPQVRHTLLAVAREYSTDGCRAAPTSDDERERSVARGWGARNAPFMSAYEATLTFTQHQVMRGYADAHGAGSSASLEAWISNVISGGDAPWFQNGSAEQMPADLFWRRVFQAAWLRLFARAAAPGGALYRWLVDSGAPWPGAVAARTLAWLGARDRVEAGDRTTWYGLRPELLCESDAAGALLGGRAKNDSDQDVVRPLVLSLWLLAVLGLIPRWLEARTPSGAHEPAGPGHPYFALHDDPTLVTVTVLVVILLLGGAGDPPASAATNGQAIERVEAQIGMGLRVALGDEFVYVVADSYHGDADTLDALGDDHRQRVLQIVVPTRQRLDTDSRARTPANRQDGITEIRAARIERIGAAALIGQPGPWTRAELIRRWAEDPTSPTHSIVEDLS